MPRDYYAVLGVPTTATPIEIKRAFWRGAEKCNSMPMHRLHMALQQAVQSIQDLLALISTMHYGISLIDFMEGADHQGVAEPQSQPYSMRYTGYMNMEI